MKKLFFEITSILVLAIIIAIIYNFNNSKPLSYFYHKEIIKTIDDSILFNSMPNYSKNESSSKAQDTNSKINSKIIDSAKIAKPSLGIKKESNEINIQNVDLKKTLSYEQMLKIINNPKFLIIDARSSVMFSENHIGNAINIFPYDDEQVYIPKILNLPQDRTIIVYCDGGQCDASHKLAEAILNFGYNKVFIYSGGWEEWSQKQGIK